MRLYIHGTSCISPQNTFLQESFLNEPVDYVTPYLNCIEPVYKDYINPVLARRLTRYIKMGVTTALTALKDAQCEMPGAIITGTGLGSTEDNEKILEAMNEYQESLINPTHFIQSTHNTISSQIAIMLRCHNYNSTYVHRGFSFETALLDALLLLQEGKAETALVTGVDAITKGHYDNYARINRWKTGEHHSLQMLDIPGDGVIPGEGSASFLVSAVPMNNSYAQIAMPEFIYKPVSADEVINHANKLLEKHQLKTGDIDLLILGNSGDAKTDHFYKEFSSAIFPSKAIGYYKHLCGEYDTASAFALWLASMIIKKQEIPDVIMHASKPTPVNHLLIYTHHRGDQHSLFLVSRI